MNIKSSILRFIKVSFLLFLVYIILALGYLFVFSNKLSATELELVTEHYEEMRLVNPEIKSEFYVDILIKLLDKQYIIEEMRKDSLTYSVYVVNRAFEIFAENINARDTGAYLRRCYLDFDTFVGLENSKELFELSLSFFVGGTQQIDDFSTFGTFMDSIIANEYIYLNEVSINRENAVTNFVISYIVLVLFFYFVDIPTIIEAIQRKIKQSKLPYAKKNRK